MIERICATCSKTFKSFPSQKRKCCSDTCRHKYQSTLAPKSIGYWNGHRYFLHKGYPVTKINDKQVPIHVLVCEKALGKKLPKGAIVHHLDKNRLNFSNDNLVILQSVSEHTIIHRNMRLVELGGNVGIHKICTICHNVKTYSEFHKNNSNYDGLSFSCKTCFCEYVRKRSNNKTSEVTP